MWIKRIFFTLVMLFVGALAIFDFRSLSTITDNTSWAIKQTLANFNFLHPNIDPHPEPTALFFILNSVAILASIGNIVLFFKMGSKLTVGLALTLIVQLAIMGVLAYWGWAGSSLGIFGVVIAGIIAKVSDIVQFAFALGGASVIIEALSTIFSSE